MLRRVGVGIKGRKRLLQMLFKLCVLRGICFVFRFVEFKFLFCYFR